MDRIAGCSNVDILPSQVSVPPRVAWIWNAHRMTGKRSIRNGLGEVGSPIERCVLPPTPPSLPFSNL
jgi:hypothetical protein